MGAKKRNKNKILERENKETHTYSNYSVPARNLRKTDLGGVIFGCKNNTINECLSNNLFGLPAAHYSYVQNIREGLVLFLFNYSDRKLHGIFEAASPGQMNINRYAWVPDNDGEYTSYPAQVRISVRQQCQQPLSEDQFGPVIADNYYENQHFYFELDQDQANKLISLFTSSSVNARVSSSLINIPAKRLASIQYNETGSSSSWDAPLQTGISYASMLGRNNRTTTTTATGSQPTGTWSALFKTESTFEANTKDERDKVDELPQEQQNEDKAEFHNANSWEESLLLANNTDVECWEDFIPTEEHEDKAEFLKGEETLSQLIPTGIDEVKCVSELNPQENHKEDDSLVLDTIADNSCTNLETLLLKLMQEVEMLKGSQLNHITNINLLEQELDKSKLEIQQLKNRVVVLESGSRSVVEFDSNKYHAKFVESVYIVGGFDGSSWLSTLDSYFPSHDIKNPLSPMNFVKKYASAATLNGEIYHFGGMGSHTVESFSPTKNQWIPRPPLYWKNLNAAGASVNEKLYVVGGSKDGRCSAEVEYLDLNIGQWLPILSMHSKRLAPSAAELKNVLYVSGGYDGVSYSSSVEMLDPRENSWLKLPNMNTRKGCHSMVVLNEKLYTVGGFDGDKYVAKVECLDTRMGGWVETEAMNVCRGNFGAFVIGEILYAIGGLKENNQVLDIVECYKEGGCWEVSDLKAIGKRSHFSAVVM